MKPFLFALVLTLTLAATAPAHAAYDSYECTAMVTPNPSDYSELKVKALPNGSAVALLKTAKGKTFFKGAYSIQSDSALRKVTAFKLLSTNKQSAVLTIIEKHIMGRGGDLTYLQATLSYNGTTTFSCDYAYPN